MAEIEQSEDRKCTEIERKTSRRKEKQRSWSQEQIDSPRRAHKQIHWRDKSKTSGKRSNTILFIVFISSRTSLQVSHYFTSSFSVHINTESSFFPIWSIFSRSLFEKKWWSGKINNVNCPYCVRYFVLISSRHCLSCKLAWLQNILASDIPDYWITWLRTSSIWPLIGS
mgnify:CR=1 FL=1